MNRRDFTKTSAMAALSAAFLPNFEKLSAFAPDNRHIGVQLWSVKDDMEADASQTIIEISKMGYTDIETFLMPGGEKGKIFGMNAKEFKTLLKNLEIKSPSGHYPLPFKNQGEKDPLNDEAKRLVDFAALLGQKYVVLPYVMPNDRSPENFAKVALTLNKASEYAKTVNESMTVCYHNHDFEFLTKVGDQTAYEFLLTNTAPEVMFEMDVYWVNKAKANCIDLFKKYPGRFPLLHMKDMADTTERETIEIGEGLIDFEAIIKEKRTSGAKYYFVELEHYQDTPMKGIKTCYKAMDKLLTKKK